MTLTDFLLARYAEDEGTALYAQTRDDLQPEDWAGWWFGHQQHYSRHDPARVLADVESKRRIVELARENTQRWEAGETQFIPDDTACVLQLALPYADHPDYREEWAL